MQIKQFLSTDKSPISTHISGNPRLQAGVVDVCFQSLQRILTIKAVFRKEAALIVK